MSNKLKARIQELLDVSKEVQVEFFSREMSDAHHNYDSEEVHAFKASCELSFTLVDEYGGEGQGEDYWTVYSFSDGHDVVYVKFQGWYASYNGAEFTEYSFVSPKERMVTFYE